MDWKCLAVITMRLKRHFIWKWQSIILLITGGSDFHGMIKPNIRIGGVDMLYMEDMLTAQLLDALGMTASS